MVGAVVANQMHVIRTDEESLGVLMRDHPRGSGRTARAIFKLCTIVVSRISVLDVSVKRTTCNIDLKARVAEHCNFTLSWLSSIEKSKCSERCTSRFCSYMNLNPLRRKQCGLL